MLLRLLRYLKHSRWMVALALLSMGGVALCTGAYMSIVKFIFDDLLVPKNAAASTKFAETLRRFGVSSAVDVRSDLVLILSAFLILAFFKALFTYTSTSLMGRAGNRIGEDVRRDIYRAFHIRPLSFFDRHSIGTLISYVIYDASMVQTAVTGNLVSIVQQAITALVLYGVMLHYAWDLALYALIGAPLAVWLIYYFGARMRRVSRVGLENISGASDLVKETFSAVKIVKIFGMENYEMERFGRVNAFMRRMANRVVRVQALAPPFMEFGGGILGAALIWAGHSRIARGEMTTGDFAAFLAALFSMYNPFKQISGAHAQVQLGLAAAQRLFAVMDAAPGMEDRPGAVPLQEIRRGIEFKDVGFHYEGAAAQVLRGISFFAARGEKVALVGPSGAGKTTLVSLLPRFYDAVEGAVEIDGRDIRDLTLASLRARMAIVTQDTFLFDDTAQNNIRYGRWNASPEDIEAAARAANAHDFIRALPRGYDTRIGENGQSLSGGERQRLAIARAILKNPDVLILDEATSDLDARSEAAVVEAFGRLLQGRTAFIIAHRLSTVLHADRILVMEHGRLAAQGRHEELLTRSPLYRELYELQFKKGAAARSASAPA